MTNLRRSGLILLIALLSMSMVACSISAVVVDLEIAISVVKVGTPIAAAFSGPGAVVVVAYMTAAANGLSCVLTAAEAAGATTATVSAAFATCLAGAVVPVLPAGTPPEVAAIVAATAAAISFLLNRYGPKSAAAAQGGKPMPIHLNIKDRMKIHSMQKDLATSVEKLGHAH